MSEEKELQESREILKKHGINYEEQEKDAKTTAELMKKLDQRLVYASKRFPYTDVETR